VDEGIDWWNEGDPGSSLVKVGTFFAKTACFSSL
jgi:hypothetical protein